MTMHMHSVGQRYIDALATHEQKVRLYPDVVEQGKLFGSWGSEPTGRGDTGVRETILLPSDGGYVITGRKHFCTMAGAAYRYMVHCVMEGYDHLDGTIMALVPSDAPGMTISGEWDTLGMRATVSPGVVVREMSRVEGRTWWVGRATTCGTQLVKASASVTLRSTWALPRGRWTSLSATPRPTGSPPTKHRWVSTVPPKRARRLPRPRALRKPESTEGGRQVSVLKWQEGAPVLLG